MWGWIELLPKSQTRAVACVSAGAFKVVALPMGVAVGGAGMGAAALAPAVIVGAGVGSIAYLGVKHGPKTAKAVGRTGKTLGSQFCCRVQCRQSPPRPGRERGRGRIRLSLSAVSAPTSANGPRAVAVLIGWLEARSRSLLA